MNSSIGVPYVCLSFDTSSAFVVNGCQSFSFPPIFTNIMKFSKLILQISAPDYKMLKLKTQEHSQIIIQDKENKKM